MALQKTSSSANKQASISSPDIESTWGAPARGKPSSKSVQHVLASPGVPLDKTTRAFFEPRFGRNLQDIRVHSDVSAHRALHNLWMRTPIRSESILFSIPRSMLPERLKANSS